MISAQKPDIISHFHVLSQAVSGRNHSIVSVIVGVLTVIFARG